MKSEYMIPDVNVIQFETEDVLNASGGLNYGGNVTEGGGPSIDAGDLFN